MPAAANVSWDAERNLNRHLWPFVTFLCKSLVFGFVDADSFRYFDNIYDPQIKFISKYLRPMVIDCKRPDQIPWILWGDIRDLSQILHYPGNDSKCVKQSRSVSSLNYPLSQSTVFIIIPIKILTWKQVKNIMIEVIQLCLFSTQIQNNWICDHLGPQQLQTAVFRAKTFACDLGS